MLPNLIVIGAMKCGTTSLRYYLRAHPEIFMARGGLNFFVAEEEGNWHRGAEWYESQFGAARIRGDTSPRYANYPLARDVPERMHALVPEAKLLYIVRDPIERLISHYCQYWAAGKEDRSLAQALDGIDDSPQTNPYVCRGLYFLQIERFLRCYPRAQLLVLYQEDLRDRRLATLQEIFRFLGVDESFSSPEFERISHRTADKRRLSPIGSRLKQSGAMRILGEASPRAHRRVERAVASAFGRTFPRPTPPPRLREKLNEIYREDTRRFHDLVGGEPPPWRGER